MSSSVAIGRERSALGIVGPHSILFWLRLLVLVCVLPAWAMTTWMIVAAGLRERSAQEHSMVDTARALMQAVDRELASTVVGLQALATSRSLAERDFAGFQRQSAEALSSLGDGNIVLVDRSGHELTNTARAYGDPLPQVQLGGPVDAVFRTGKPAISDLFLGGLTSHPIVAIAVPVILDGRVAYCLGMGIFPESLSEVLQRQHFPADWVAGIVDSTGTLVARTRNEEQFIGKKATPLSLRQIGSASEGVFEGDSREGISLVVGFSRSTVSGWTLGIGIPSAELMAPLYRSLRLTILAAIALLLFALLSAWLIGSRIARSIRALSGPALSLATDAPVLPRPIEIREVNEIGGALAKASHLLKARQKEREEAEQVALREREERLRLALEGGRLGMFDRDLKTGAYVWNEQCYRLFGYQVGEVVPSRAAWMARVHPDDRPATEEEIARAMRERKDYVREFRVVHPDGSVCWLHVHGRFLYDADELIRLIGLVEDVTEMREQIETQRVMVAELQHRTRNLMAVVHSIALQTLSTTGSPTEFAQKFDRRLQALSRVQSLLSRADNGAITLGALVGMELEAIGSESFANRISVGGPEVPLRKSAVEMLALAIHELATNALKYGALASTTGRLSVTWGIVGMGATRQVVLEWIERGIVAAPATRDRRGYGRELIEEALPYSLSAQTAFELTSDELRCTIALPLTASGAQEAVL